ncbi:hypothetical protein [Amycolatopsis pithecellobii]|uniref:hypothetical protein n=1 Tax=Amycolatopsis pithecellobii TaxID=664692 RepID=UPI001AA029E7|nr:hypothetical protein [Amycolatopsis pithecellobii]
MLRERVHDLLSPDNGALATQLRPLADALVSTERPRSVLSWLRHSTSAKLLAALVADHNEITHDRLDQQPQALALEVRIAGALTRLYGFPMLRIFALTADRFHRDDNGAYLTFERHAVLLGQPAYPAARFLLPGKLPDRPRHTQGVYRLLRKHGLPTNSARNTALIESAATLPPIVISDLFGISPDTAQRWARYAQDSWADYLAAAQPR